MDLPVCQDRVNRYHHCNDGPDAYLSSPTFPGEELKAEVVHAGARVAAGRICVRGRLVDKSTLRLRYEVCAQSPDAHTDGGLGAVLIHTMVVAVAVAAISLPAQGQSSPEHLVKLNSRTFDLATDIRELRRDADFVPLNEIGWLGPILDADPVLGPTVFHLKMADPSMVSASWLWQWEVNQDQQPGSGQSYDYKYSRNIPERFQIPGYEARANNEDGLGGVIMIPSDPNADYAISCSQDRKIRRSGSLRCQGLIPS